MMRYPTAKLCNIPSMAIPTLEDRGGAYDYLPPGDHVATIDEVSHVFGSSTFRRRQLMDGLRQVVAKLREFGVETIWVDGSFISSKERPGDVDVIYVRPSGADTSQWGLLSPSRRDAAKQYFGCDLWEHPSCGRHAGGKAKSIKQFFDTDNDGIDKGHILLRRDDDQE